MASLKPVTLEDNSSSDKPNDSGQRTNNVKPLRYFEPQCSRCFDIGWIGGRRCECFTRRRIAERLERLNKRYPVFSGFDLMSLKPYGHPAQAELIPRIQANPGASLILLGDTETGKTLIGYVMAKYAIEQGRPVVAMMLDELLDQYRQQSLDPERLPEVDAETLRCADARYLLFLDDLDKAATTEFAMRKFFHLVNAASETRQQVIVTSNLTMPLLMARWERAAPDGDPGVSQYGAPILRRLCGLPDAIMMDFFEGGDG